jgi:hypothetical protein
MKVRLFSKFKQMASTLVITMVIGGILCMFVVYYLSLIEQQNKLGARSQCWNLAIAIAEAGIEEAMEEINLNFLPVASDGWTPNGTVYTHSRTFADQNSYTVSINLSNLLQPVIVSRAYVVTPTYAQAAPSTFFASIGGNQTVVPITRAVRVTCSQGNLFTAAMVSKHSITLNGNGVSADSYDSSDPSKSTDGRYDPWKYAGDRGDVATDDSLIVGVGNANIYGHLHTGATGGYSMGPNGAVGTHAWQATHTGMEQGYFAQDANFTFPTTDLPNTANYLTPKSGWVTVASNNIIAIPVLTNTLPGTYPWGGVTTNANNTTSSIYPNPAPAGLTTNTTFTTSTTYPNPAPAAGVSTNITGYTILSTLPSPVPSGTTTNTSMVTNSPTVPFPPPVGTTTNSSWVNDVTTLPTPMPSVVTTNYGKGKDKNTIMSYNYLAETYNYPVYTYNIPSSWSYTYPVYTYTYPVYTYAYNLYQTNVVYLTNYYQNILEGNGKYVVSALTSNTIVMGPDVQLVLPNGLTGGEHITFNYSNYQEPGLTIFAGGTSATISGNQYINPSGFAGSLIIYCAPTVTSFTLNGNGQFTGVLVAPNADLKMNGGGNSYEDFMGSLMVNSVVLNGHFRFHWDEALGRMRSLGRMLVTTWDEIP